MNDSVELHKCDLCITREDQNKLKGHRSFLIWLTGLSGSGKSTLGNLLFKSFYSMRLHAFLLDADNVRQTLNAPPQILEEFYGEKFAKRFGLGFSQEDRSENIRRIGAMSKLFIEAGIITISAFISPYRRDRDLIRNSLNKDDFIEIYLNAPLEVCEKRDKKMLYKKAREGSIKNFTGIDDCYEPPINPELILDSSTNSPQQLLETVINYLKIRNLLFN